MDLAPFKPGANITISFDGPCAPCIPGAHAVALPQHPPGFYAGANRNYGLRSSYLKYGKTGYVLFLDGDRVPLGYSPAIIHDTLARYQADALLLTCLNDNRAIAQSPLSDGPVDAGCLVSEFYSCGIVLTDGAISAIMELNGGELFHPAFNGHWGEEDKYLGIQLDALGFKTCFTNRIKLGGGTLGGMESHPDYGISLQTRMDLMRRNGYPIRNEDRYARLEKDTSGHIVKVYIGEGLPK